ncbi:hypothetical protein Pmar_PMAR021343 [Perkinsus marinus ATCC 50983]|uniref:Uncharacterized protein n=1 Tax=Perkinsus marinus (strain ATCC 50983 / TXsc) TaxID=423536 RepID=C5KMB5_PERM5|nr:hypothetical protein Pmar_PMAR021343 [Perkinsus marinus ATCC 50983]EER14369.1 hypothetical protein Pmar_PMAR021343 [Perkinsus marinus ATCC 50983]|eukprot:XP_002782574.1 hypothetical protein Pmar_PMAR021343 [Perkinsus marinus ATCC 50983]
MTRPKVEEDASALRLELAMVRAQLRDQTIKLMEASRHLSEADIAYESNRIEKCVDLTEETNGSQEAQEGPSDVESTRRVISAAQTDLNELVNLTEV